MAAGARDQSETCDSTQAAQCGGQTDAPEFVDLVKCYHHFEKSLGFWYGLSFYTQKGVIEKSKARTLAAVGEDISKDNETREKVEIAKVEMTDKDREISIDVQRVITIPAAAISPLKIP